MANIYMNQNKVQWNLTVVKPHYADETTCIVIEEQFVKAPQLLPNALWEEGEGIIAHCHMWIPHPSLFSL